MTEALDEDENTINAYDCKFIVKAKQRKDLIVNPIIDWSDTDIWEYIRNEKIKYNPLYDKGYHRVGCVGCPLGGSKSMMKEFSDYPKFKENYIRAFDRMLEERKKKGLATDKWTSGQDVFEWWLGRRNWIRGQLSFDEDMEIK